MTRFRPATADDVAFMVPLIAESSGGVWPAFWRALAVDGETAEMAAEKYLADCSNDLSVANTTIAEADELRLGLMSTYRENHSPSTETESSPLPTDLVEALQPYRTLSDPDSLYIAELCCVPEARGQGLGSRFLTQAQEAAAEQGLPRVSLRVFTENVGAVRLYERFGFRRIDQKPIVAHPDISASGSVMLMACDV